MDQRTARMVNNGAVSGHPQNTDGHNRSWSTVYGHRDALASESSTVDHVTLSVSSASAAPRSSLCPLLSSPRAPRLKLCYRRNANRPSFLADATSARHLDSRQFNVTRDARNTSRVGSLFGTTYRRMRPYWIWSNFTHFVCSFISFHPSLLSLSRLPSFT